MIKLFEFKNGKLSTFPEIGLNAIKGFALTTLILLIVSFLAGLFKLSDKDIWKIYHLILQHFGLSSRLPEIKNKPSLDAKAEVEVDRALREYEELTGDYGVVKLPAPIFSEKPVDVSVCYTDECKSLGGEMRLCSPWYEGCSKNDKFTEGRSGYNFAEGEGNP